MDEHLWSRSRLGRTPAAQRGPVERRRRIDARSHVGQRLRAWRNEHGISQAEAHRRLGLAGPTSRMHQLEHGEVPWEREDVAAVAGVLGVEPDSLVREVMEASDPAETQRRAAFVSWARTLPADEWRAVVQEVEQRR